MSLPIVLLLTGIRCNDVPAKFHIRDFCRQGHPRIDAWYSNPLSLTVLLLTHRFVAALWESKPVQENDLISQSMPYSFQKVMMIERGSAGLRMLDKCVLWSTQDIPTNMNQRITRQS